MSVPGRSVTVTMVTLIFVCYAHAKIPSGCHPWECDLPECYCKYEDIPGSIAREDTPQMILFTYSGALTQKVRRAITDIFPATLKNPNSCSVGITLFVVNQGSDDCGIHKLYVRGHEVALAGVNRTGKVDGWEQDKWKESIVTQQLRIEEQSNIDAAEMVGMRAQMLRPGGDAQFQMLSDNLFAYDSSFLAGPSAERGFTNPYLWPFSLKWSLQELDIKCTDTSCPLKAYPILWEVPVSPLVGTRKGQPNLCTYLEDCLKDYNQSSQVTDLLRRNFLFSYNGNRAPLMINLRPRTLETRIAVEGMKDFIKYVKAMDDTWILTIQEALAWVQNPTTQGGIMEQRFWKCPDRIYVKCSETDGSNSTVKKTTFGDIMDVNSIWIWQTVIFSVLYVAIYRYDRDVQDKKNKKRK